MFGKTAELYLHTLNQLPLAQLRKSYTFMKVDEFRNILESDLSKGMQIYWHEMLQRAHLAAATSILRSRRWLDGIISATTDKNVLLFAAALRGFIESAADTNTSLLRVPKTIATNRVMIATALAGQANIMHIADELEEMLIHFSHARKLKKGEVAPTYHQTKRVVDYIEVLEKASGHRVVESYSELCDFTHAGWSSVALWFGGDPDVEEKLVPCREEWVMDSLLERYQPIFVELLMLAFNTPVITLATLNYFPTTELHTPELRKWNLSDIQEWKTIQEAMRAIS